MNHYEEIKATYEKDAGIGGIGRLIKKPEIVSENKERMSDLLDKFASILDKNKGEIDKIVGEGEVDDLIDSIKNSKGILEATGLVAMEKSSGKEILRSIETSLVGFILRARRKSDFEENKNSIRECFLELKDFIHLTVECAKFRETEFGGNEGFLTEDDNKDEGANLRMNLNKYIEKCKEKASRNN